MLENDVKYVKNTNYISDNEEACDTIMTKKDIPF
jgi:hypothetical protein